MEKVKYYESLANNGDLSFIEYCSFSYLMGKNSFPKVKHLFQKINFKDLQKAHDISLEGWKKNSPLCTGFLGYCYDKGFGTKKNEIEAFKCFFEGSQLGDIWSKQQLGIKFQKRVGDLKEAEKCFKEAIDEGDVFSLFFLGYLYERGVENIEIDTKFKDVVGNNEYKKTQVEQSTLMAYKYYKMFNEKCTETEYQYLKDTADIGDDEDQITIGLLYEKGLYVSQDLSEAYKYYKLAMESGNLDAKKLFENLVSPDEYQQFCFGRKALEKELVDKGEELFEKFEK
jgi:TPR repeat protein